VATGPRYRVEYRRKREGKTNYRKRLKLLQSGKPRLVVRRSSNHIIVQFINFAERGDEVIASSHSNELKKYGWQGGTSNVPAAYLTGLLCGLKAKGKVKEAVLDIGFATPVKGSRVFAALKGVVDAGIHIPHSKEIFPDESRIRGEHIANYANSLKEKKEKFSKYLERGLDPAELPTHFDEIVAKIKGE
jgi:large subunit ribosomal protein L18